MTAEINGFNTPKSGIHQIELNRRIDAIEKRIDKLEGIMNDIATGLEADDLPEGVQRIGERSFAIFTKGE